MSAGCRHSIHNATANRTSVAPTASVPTPRTADGGWKLTSSATVPAAIIAAAESV